MGVKARRCGLQDLRRISPPEVLLIVCKKQLPQCWRLHRKVISPLFLFGSTFFVLGLVSLLAGHIASHSAWCSQLRRPWGFRQGHSHQEPIAIWKSKFSASYYACSDRSHRFKAAVPESKSNGSLLIATSGGLNQQRTGDLNAEGERSRGKCPLTPHEVGLMLRALGFGNNT